MIATAMAAHFVSYAQAILYRGAGLDIVWPHFLLVAAVGGTFFILAAARFRQSLASIRA